MIKHTSAIDNTFNVIGSFGGAIFVASLLIQLRYVIKRKSSEDLSLWWLVFTEIAILCGLAYGIYFILYPLIIMNSLQAVANGLIIISKFYYKKVIELPS
jgi:uncharacterized protein with PQ loop repeat